MSLSKALGMVVLAASMLTCTPAISQSILVYPSTNSFSEDAGTVAFFVDWTPLAGAQFYRVSMSDGTAVEGYDFHGTFFHFIQSEGTIVFNVFSDAIPEPTENFFLNVTAFIGVNAIGFGSAELTIIDNDSYTSAIPEPETYALLLAGLGVLGFAARRRKLKLAA